MLITILGGGSWGTALALHLARKSHTVRVWEFFQEQADEMQQQRYCRLLPGVKLPGNITVSHQMEKVLPGSELIIMAVPSDKVEKTMEAASALVPALIQQPIIIASKGFASNLRLLSDVVTEKVSGEVYCLYGPTHAEEVCQGLFSGIVLAGGKGKERLRTEIESPTLKVDLSDDIIGVQVCAALKNILAILIGVLDGKGLGDNAKAFVMTKGLDEIRQVGLKWGAKTETFYGLAGLGDVIVTCTSVHSRNFHVGREIGKGRKLAVVLPEMKMVAEGVTTAKSIPELCNRFNLNLPLLMGTSAVLFEGKEMMKVLEES